MPNHCQNRLVLRGPAAELARFKAQASELGVDDRGRAIAFALECFVPKPPPGDPRRIPSDTHQGGWDWYSWCLANWGSKWDVYESALVQETVAGGRGQITYSFDSAWAPPEEGIGRVAMAYPELDVELFFMEAGMQYYGRIAWSGDELLVEELTEYSSEDYDRDDATGDVTEIHDPLLAAHVDAHGFGWTA